MKLFLVLLLGFALCGCVTSSKPELLDVNTRIHLGASFRADEHFIVGQLVDDLEFGSPLSMVLLSPNKVAIMCRLRTGDVECFLLDLATGKRSQIAIFPQNRTMLDWEIAYCGNFGGEAGSGGLLLISYTLANGSMSYEENSTWLETFYLRDDSNLLACKLQIGTKNVAHPSEEEFKKIRLAPQFLNEAVDTGGPAKKRVFQGVFGRFQS